MRISKDDNYMIKIKKESIFAILLAFGISTILIIEPVSACSNKKEIYNNFKWVESNGQLYLDIRATDYYSLGQLEGSQLNSQILGLKVSIQALFANYGIPYEYLIQLAYLYENYVPEEYIEEMTGIADVLKPYNITYSDILLQNCFIDIYYGQLVPQMSGNPLPPLEMACTAIASKNKDNSITIGQNFDFSSFLHPTLSFVRHQIKGKPVIFSLRMGAMLGLPVGKNSNGVYSTITVIKTIVMGSIGIPSTSRTRMAFEKSKKASDFYEILWGENIPTSFNSILADKKNNAIGSENIPNLSSIKEITTAEYLIRTNTYITEEFKPYLLDPSYSIERHQKAIELVDKYFNDDSLTLKELILILRYEDGTNASITRAGSTNPEDPQTGAFISFKSWRSFSFGVFGLGNPVDNSLGIVPF